MIKEDFVQLAEMPPSINLYENGSRINGIFGGMCNLWLFVKMFKKALRERGAYDLKKIGF